MWVGAQAQSLTDPIAIVLHAGKGVVMRLIKSTLGFGKTQEGWEFGGGRGKGAIGDKGDSLRATRD